MTVKEMAKLGGKKRAESLSPERRREIAMMGVKAREGTLGESIQKLAGWLECRSFREHMRIYKPDGAPVSHYGSALRDLRKLLSQLRGAGRP